MAKNEKPNVDRLMAENWKTFQKAPKGPPKTRYKGRGRNPALMQYAHGSSSQSVEVVNRHHRNRQRMFERHMGVDKIYIPTEPHTPRERNEVFQARVKLKVKSKIFESFSAPWLGTKHQGMEEFKRIKLFETGVKIFYMWWSAKRFFVERVDVLTQQSSLSTFYTDRHRLIQDLKNQRTLWALHSEHKTE